MCSIHHSAFSLCRLYGCVLRVLRQWNGMALHTLLLVTVKLTDRVNRASPAYAADAGLADLLAQQVVASQLRRRRQVQTANQIGLQRSFPQADKCARFRAFCRCCRLLFSTCCAESGNSGVACKSCAIASCALRLPRSSSKKPGKHRRRHAAPQTKHAAAGGCAVRSVLQIANAFQ